MNRKKITLALVLILCVCCFATAFASDETIPIGGIYPYEDYPQLINNSFDYEHIKVNVSGIVEEPYNIPIYNMPLAVVSLAEIPQEILDKAIALFMGKDGWESAIDDDGSTHLTKLDADRELSMSIGSHGISFTSQYVNSEDAVAYGSANGIVAISLLDNAIRDIKRAGLGELFYLNQDFKDRIYSSNSDDIFSYGINLPRKLVDKEVSADIQPVDIGEIPKSNILRQESLNLTLDAQSNIINFEWHDPLNLEEISYVNPISLNEAMEVFKQNVNYYGWSTPDENGETSPDTLNITEIRLALMRIRNTDSPDQFTIIPVWDFIGYPESSKLSDEGNMLRGWYENNADMRSFLTVNATDGTLVNRYTGY